jgi:hypothetical protein
MKRFGIGLVCTATLVCAGLLPDVLTAKVAAAGDPSVETTCPGTLSATTFTLTANCATSAPLTVPDGHTVNGAGHTITATDPSASVPFNGAVLTNDPTGHSMIIENLTIQGTFAFTGSCPPLQAGILFHDASGTVNGATVKGITEHGGACQAGYGILSIAEAGVPRTIAITMSAASGYQKTAWSPGA